MFVSIFTNNRCRQSLTVAVIVFFILSLFLLKDHYSLFGSTKSDNMFVYLAQSFLHGKLDLGAVPTYHDLSIFNNRTYAFWPPLCAFLLMPAVALHGVYVGDRWFSIIFVALTAFAGWLIIEAIDRRAGRLTSVGYQALLIAFLAFGTSNIIFSIIGSHWYMAQLAAAMMMFFAVLMALGLKPSYMKSLAMGGFWALAILSRMHLILAAPFFFYVAVCDIDGSPDWRKVKEEWREKLLNLIVLVIPVILILTFYAWYNWMRFGSIFDTGISHHNMWPRFEADYHKYGYFNIHYLWHNIYFTLLRLPIFQNQDIFKGLTDVQSWTEGYSLFYQCPVLLYAFLSLRALKKDRLIAILWLSVALVACPILCLMGTGWIQFGARYLFDLVPLLFPLAIIGTNGKVSALLIALVIISVVVNLHGLFILTALFDLARHK